MHVYMLSGVRSDSLDKPRTKILEIIRFCVEALLPSCESDSCLGVHAVVNLTDVQFNMCMHTGGGVGGHVLGAARRASGIAALQAYCRASRSCNVRGAVPGPQQRHPPRGVDSAQHL